MKRRNAGFKSFSVLTLLAVLGCIVFFFGYRYFMEQAYPMDYAEIVKTEAEENGIKESLVYAVICAESGFKEDAKSHAGALGLMQLMPETFDWLKSSYPEDQHLTEAALYHPQINIAYGCRLLRLLSQRYEDLSVVLCAYNAGIGTVEQWLKDPAVSHDGKTLCKIPYAETDQYVKRIVRNLEIYQKLYDLT